MSVIAIDGPAGAGKTTLARAVAKAVGWDFIDTGAMYRAITLGAKQKGVATDDADSLAGIAATAQIEMRGDTVWLDGADVTARIRERDITAAAPEVAAHPEVRKALVEWQREIAGSRDVVMEGRDIGTVVVPDAVLKIFLNASLPERARRRAAELDMDGSIEELEAMERTIASRDAADSGRVASPLQKAPDAIEIDTTDRSVTEIVDEISNLLRERVDGL